MTAGEYCNREVIITGQNVSVTEAAMLMRQHPKLVKREITRDEKEHSQRI
jgi:hypothetical protein